MSVESAIVAEYANEKQLTEDQLRLFNKFTQNENLGVQRLFVHMNAEVEDKTELISGYTAVLDKDAKVSSQYLNDCMFAQTMLFELESSSGNKSIEASDFDASTSAALDTLNRSLQQRSDAPPSLACRVNDREGTSLKDGRMWISCLGDEGRVGLYSEEYGIDKFRYYLLVNVGKTQASYDLFHWIDEQPEGALTVDQLMNSVQGRYVRSINRRNAQRIAVKVAQSIGVLLKAQKEWGKNAVTEDSDAFVPNKYTLKPSIALPCVHNEYNIYRAGTYDREERKVLYDNCYCTTKCKGALLLMQAPREPLLLFPPISKSRDGNAQIGVVRNSAVCSFPVTLGLCMTEREALDIRNEIGDEERQLVNKRVTWEGKQRHGMQWFNHRVMPGMFRRYNVNDALQGSVLHELYSENLQQIKVLKPIIVKISKSQYPGYEI